MIGEYLIVFRIEDSDDKDIKNYTYKNINDLEIDICDIRRNIRDMYDTYKIITILNIIKLSK